MFEAPVHLLDVNVVLALLQEDHLHYAAAQKWFHAPGQQWALCAFTEAGVLRLMTRPKTEGLTIEQATSLLEEMRQLPGYHHQPVTDTWSKLTKPFFQRIHGHNQITDAYLLGLAIAEGLVLTTFDRAFLHLAGEHKNHVLILEAT